MPSKNVAHSPIRTPVRSPVVRRWPVSTSSYSETLVSNGGTRYLTRASNLSGATDAATGLFFFSGTHTNSASANEYIVSGNALSSRIRRNNTGTPAITWQNTSAVANISITSGTTITTSRYAILAALDVNGTSNLSVWSGGSWVNGTDPTGGAVNLDFTESGFKLFASELNAQIFNGSAARVACWFGITLPDITQTSVRDNFINSTTGETVDPALSVAAYGTPIVDFYGSAATWEAGTNQGSGGNFTAAGTGSFT